MVKKEVIKSSLIMILSCILMSFCTGNLEVYADTMVYAGMTEDFTKISEQPEHRRWTQGCASGGRYGAFGVCGCRTQTSPVEHTGCWNSIRMGSGGQNGDTIGNAGCVVTSIAMLVAESGVTEDSNFNPADFFKWGKAHNMWGSTRDTKSSVNGYAWINNYNSNITHIERVQIGSSNQETVVAKVEEQLARGCMMIGRVNDNAHTVFVLGTGINPQTGQKDVIICDPAPNPLGETGDNFYLHGAKNKCTNSYLMRVEVFKVEGETFYITSGGIQQGSTNTNTNLLQNTSFSVGSAVFTDDATINVPTMDFNLVEVDTDDILELSNIKIELEMREIMERWSIIYKVTKIIGIILILYLIIFALSYMVEYSEILDIKLFKYVTFGYMTVIRQEEEEYVSSVSEIRGGKCITKKAFIVTMIVGVIIACLLIGGESLMQTLLTLYYSILESIRS